MGFKYETSVEHREEFMSQKLRCSHHYIPQYPLQSVIVLIVRALVLLKTVRFRTVCTNPDTFSNMLE